MTQNPMPNANAAHAGDTCGTTGGLCLCRLALAVGLTWGLACFLVGVATIYLESYGQAFVDMMGSLYPGYVVGTWAGAGMGLLWGAVDGFIGVLVIAVVYRLIGKGAGQCCCGGAGTSSRGPGQPDA